MTNHQIMGVLAIALFIAVLFVAVFRRWRRRRSFTMDDMEGLEFEQYCAALLEQNGFTKVKVTAGSGDFGADILAQRDGITYAVQCKCYDHPVGVAAVQEVYAGRDFYDCMVGAVMTNAYFTNPAVTMAEKLNILLWDREDIDRMSQA